MPLPEMHPEDEPGEAPEPLPIHPVAGPPGVFGLDLGELFFQVTLRELLEQEGIGPDSKKP